MTRLESKLAKVLTFAAIKLCRQVVVSVQSSLIRDRGCCLGPFDTSTLASLPHWADRPPSTRSVPDEPREYRGEMSLRLESNRQSDLDDRHRRIQ
jgi:hypothetical protein